METRTEYPALLASLAPDQAVDILGDRVGLIKKINTDIADWLLERRKVEEAYVIGLRKLASRPQQDGGASLGIFQTPWQRIVASTENLAASHEVLAGKIQSDVENPLRQFASKDRAMQAVTSSQANFASMAKELSTTQKKADKLNAKGGSRADEASTSVDNAARQWESQAPFVFEQLQLLDERRVNHLRDVLTQLQTHEVDQVERNRASAESCLNALLNVETADEIRTYAAKIGSGGRPPPPVQRRSSAAGSSRPMSSSLQAPPVPPPRLADSNRRTSSTSRQDGLAPLPEQTPGKGKFGGLKRLGTVMNRRKSTVPPTPPQPPSEKKKDRRSFAPFRRQESSRSFADLETTGQDLTPNIVEEPQEEPARHEPTDTTSTERTEQFPNQRTNESHAAPMMVNGTSLAQPNRAETTDSVYSQPGMSAQPQSPPSQLSQLQQPLQPQSPHEMPTEASPINRAHQEAMIASPEADDSARGFAIRDKPIQEDQSEAQQAMSSMANQLRMQAQTSGLNRVQGSVRGRRDVRNSMFVPSGVDTGMGPTTGALGGAAVGAAAGAAASSLPTSSSAADLASPIARPPPRAIPEDAAVGSDTQSVHSAHSLSIQTHHPDLHFPGLNASILETVNTWFSETGITKSFVTGELALSHNPNTSTSSNETETIRLSHFEELEKVAVNPMFVNSPSSASTHDPGTYTITTSSINRPSPTVALKYQLHLDPSNLALYSPLLLTPAWQILENQTSVILLYSLNPTFTHPSNSTPLTLRNVVISISLDSSSSNSKPQSAMMAPTTHATFRRKNSSVVWRIPELIVKSEQERMLVRFMTPGTTAKKGSVEVKFEVQGRCASGLGVSKRAGTGKRESDPFADAEGGGEAEGEWVEVETRRALGTGRYCAV